MFESRSEPKQICHATLMNRNGQDIRPHGVTSPAGDGGTLLGESRHGRVCHGLLLPSLLSLPVRARDADATSNKIDGRLHA